MLQVRVGVGPLCTVLLRAGVELLRAGVELLRAGVVLLRFGTVLVRVVVAPVHTALRYRELFFFLFTNIYALE